MNPFGDLARPIINRPGMFLPLAEKRIKEKSLAPRPAKVTGHPFDLTDSQADMLNRLCAGEGNKDIARARGMTVAGVEVTALRLSHADAAHLAGLLTAKGAA